MSVSILFQKMFSTEPVKTVTVFRRPLKITRRGITISILVLILVLLLAYSAYAYTKQMNSPIADANTPTPTTVASATPSPTPTPVTLPSQLTGLPVPAGTQNLHPLAVMIENAPEARPQSGLGQADLVYEAIAEGGITRFMAIFGNPSQAIRVGPVRSARPYYVDFATELNAFYAHAGGSKDALSQIDSTGVLDINGLTVGAPVFTRDYSRPVSEEHTLYSSTDKLWQYATGTRHWSPTQTISTWKFQDDAPAAQRPASQKISVSVSGPLYAVTWEYDPANNDYKRSMDGAPHIDADTGKQITAKNIVLETAARQDYTEYYPGVSKVVGKYTLTGSGPAVVFQNGQAIKGTWRKNGTDRTRYYDSSGNEISFVKGNTWVQIVQTDSTISY
ncbi:DUF3048 domain-containing protein [Patescibacteria group bacterium]|nr:DUF3048 domain-containing protein [Patescibacteria group bacterium]